MSIRLLLATALVFVPFASHANESESETVIAQKIAALFEKVMRQQHEPGAPAMKRPVFAKAHGCVQAKFEVNPELPPELKIGVFASDHGYPAWIRFSNDGPPRPDATTSARGMAIKLVGVPGKKILKGQEDALTQDFILQNHPIFFTDTASVFLDFTEAALSRDPSDLKKYDEAHPETNRIFAEMDRAVLADPLDGQYWTPTPYRLGANAMKYMVKPCETPPSPTTKPMKDPNFLRQNFAAHLRKGESCMAFYVQLQTDAEKMPIDRATVLWSEDLSPFRLAATLRIPQGQDIDAPERERVCENLSFNSWHSLPEHEPLGSVNFARGLVYKHMADARRKHTGVTLSEPRTISPTE